MRVCCYCTLVWLACLSVTHGGEEGGGGRRWLATSDGPYRVVVSSETLEGEESVSLAVAQKKKDKEVRGDERTKRRKDVRRRRPEILPRDSIIPFLDFGKKLSTRANTIETTPREETRRRNTIHTTPREETRRRNVTRLLPVSATAIKPTESQRDLQSNESGVKLQTVLSPNYGLRLNKPEIPAVERVTRRPIRIPTYISSSNITENPVTTVPPRDSTENRPIISKETSERPARGKSDPSSPTVPVASLKHKTNIPQAPRKEPADAESIILKKEVSDMLESVKAEPPATVVTSPKPAAKTLVTATSRESVGAEGTSPKAEAPYRLTSEKGEAQPVPVATPKPTARILSTAVVTSVSVKESPWIPRHDPAKAETFQRLAMKSVDNSTSLTKGRTRSDENPAIISQNFRRKMYTTLRPKTTTYKPVTFRSVFRRNFTGLGAGVVHVLATPSTYIEVPKILNNAPSRNAGSSILTAAVSRLPSISSGVSSTYSNTPAPSPSTAPQPQPTHTTTFTSTTTTEYSTDQSTPVRNDSSVPTTSFSTPTVGNLSTNIYIVTTVPTSTNEIISSTTSRIPTSTPVDHPTPQPTSTEYSAGTENVVSITDLGSPMENSSVEIEFKPLDDHTSSTTEPPKNRSIPTWGPHLTWIYNRTNHSVFKTQAVDVAYTDSHIGLITYVLAGLAVIPLILGISVLAKKIFKKSKKKVLDESEYSSEYNRTPLPTKLPRVPPQIKWEGEKAGTEPPPQLTPTKWEFSREKLRLQTVLGQGNFGQVWKAEADDLSGHEGSTRLVAVKTVKEGSSQREKEDLLRELGIMQELGAHPNVVTLLGCCTEKEPYLLIMEYVMYGKLLAFLREHRTRAHYFNFSDLSSALTSRDLTFFSYCVARGMEYLVSKGIIHRDLAARNILVDHTKLCKIADFGMSRNVRDTGQIYEQRPNRGALPIRWMAPESLHLNLFTHKSDVWSFGILMWEIITLGSTPYNKMGGREVMREVRAGYRLDKPKTCRHEFYKVVRKCWESDPKERPTFSELKTELFALLGDPLTNGEYVDLEALTEEMSADQAT